MFTIAENMRALSNAHTQEGEQSSPCAGASAGTSPTATANGVSVGYACDPHKQWFVLRATYNREEKAYNTIVALGLKAYLPLRYVVQTIDGKKKRVTAPLIPNLLFVYTEPQTIDRHLKDTPSLSFVNYYYNHFSRLPDGRNPPLTVPYHAMINFIRVTSVGSEHVRTVHSRQCHYKSGDIVRVVEGQFAGIEGRVARVAGQQRVVVEIEGVCLVSTAYVPSAFIRKK